MDHARREIRQPHHPLALRPSEGGRPVVKPVARGYSRLTLLLQRDEELAVIPLHQEQEMVFILRPVNIFQDILG